MPWARDDSRLVANERDVDDCAGEEYLEGFLDARLVRLLHPFRP